MKALLLHTLTLPFCSLSFISATGLLSFLCAETMTKLLGHSRRRKLEEIASFFVHFLSFHCSLAGFYLISLLPSPSPSAPFPSLFL